MPKDCYEELLIPLIEVDVGGIENKEVEFDGKNMEAIVVLLDFLYRRLDRVSISRIISAHISLLIISWVD